MSDLIKDEEIPALATKTLNEVIKEVEFPDYVQPKRTRDKRLYLQITVGDTVINFFPQRSAEIAVKYFRDSVKNQLAGKRPAFVQMMFDSHVQEGLYHLLNTSHEDIKQTIQNQAAISAGFVKLSIQTHWEEKKDKPDYELVRQLRDKVIEIVSSGRKQFFDNWIEYIKQSEQPNQTLLCYFYDDVFYPMWKAAKECYKDNRKRDWKTIVQTDFDLMKLPDDLLKRLGSKGSYLSTPSRIALRHAARFCGYKKSASHKTLEGFLTESRKQQHELSKSEYSKILNDYVIKAIVRVSEHRQLAKEQNTQDKLKFKNELHRWIDECISASKNPVSVLMSIVTKYQEYRKKAKP